MTPRETPRVDDPDLRAALVADIQRRADEWRREGAKTTDEQDARACRLRAGVLEELARDLESAAVTVRR